MMIGGIIDMAKYILIWYDNNLVKHVSSKPDEGLETACLHAISIIKSNKMVHNSVVFIQNVLHSPSTYAQLWKPYEYIEKYCYLGAKAGLGTIYKINPKTGKRMSVVGYEEE